jgi:ADP-heptose:LPS heptosyltransferase
MREGFSVQRVGLLDIILSQGTCQLKAVKLFDHIAGGFIARCIPSRKKRDVVVPAGGLRVLVIRPGGLGDALLLLPVIRQMRRSGHVVEVLCEKRNAHIFTSQEGLCARVFRYNVVKEFVNVLRQQYDVVVDTEQWHLLSAITAYFIQSHFKAGFATRSARRKLFDIQVGYDLKQHELRSFARLFEFLGVAMPLELKGSYQISSVEASLAREVVGGEYVVLALGGSIALRRFSLEQAQVICKDAIGRGLSVVFVGDKECLSLAQELVVRIKDKRSVNVVGRTTLSQAAALIAGARLFIGHDSGLLHLACAIGVPVVGIFGPGNKDKWGPCAPGDKIVSLGLDCSPCTRFGYTLSGCGGGKAAPCVSGISCEGLVLL